MAKEYILNNFGEKYFFENLAYKYQTYSIPTLVVIENGKEVKLVNVNPNDPLSKIIDSLPGLVEKINDKIMDNEKSKK